ncbi:hypothetical protein FHR81_002030 [Actinoalloteichus hoggarensis]|uniref:Uncharacterized protein n=1 Tax=Actinoalloteichus hoggarensis TaxID=1470176 RepID=A0A221W5S7_9PSEU|nr:hypothetical protein AHOG_17180 [Actinoalloteichus hoggarensis]MBB5920992.1 hypothetical protein [Actinoalloteichus hoggarensis]
MVQRISPSPARLVLRWLTVPAGVAYVLITVATLAARIVAVTAGLIAEVADRLAAAGDIARADAHLTARPDGGLR